MTQWDERIEAVSPFRVLTSVYTRTRLLEEVLVDSQFLILVGTKLVQQIGRE